MRAYIAFEPGVVSAGIHSNIWAQVPDTTAFSKISMKGSYNNAWRIKIPSAVHLKHYPTMLYSHADGCAVRLAIDFSPHDLGFDGLDYMHIVLISIIDDGWKSFVKFGKVSMIEVTVDLPDVPIDSFHVLPQQTTTVKTYSNNGKLESLYLGKPKGNFYRINDRKLKRMTKGQSWPHGEMTRVERVLKNQAIPVSDLGNLPNVFEGIKLVDLPPTAPPSGKEYVWTLFCDAVAQRGLPMMREYCC